MYGALLTVHLVGLAMGLGTSIFMFILGAQSGQADFEGDGRIMRAAARAADRAGDVGVTLLILSGFGMIWINPGWAVGSIFWAKMALVVVLLGLLVLMRIMSRKVYRQGREELIRRLPAISAVILVVTLAIVVVAVQHFRP